MTTNEEILKTWNLTADYSALRALDKARTDEQELLYAQRIEQPKVKLHTISKGEMVIIPLKAFDKVKK